MSLCCTMSHDKMVSESEHEQSEGDERHADAPTGGVAPSGALKELVPAEDKATAPDSSVSIAAESAAGPTAVSESEDLSAISEEDVMV